MLEPGIHLGVERADYDRLPYLNNTSLKKWMELRDIPAEFQHWMQGRWADAERSEALLKGGALDTLLLEGSDAFAAKYAVVPEEAPKRPSKTQLNAKKPSPETIEAIRWWAEWEEAAAGKHILKSFQSYEVSRMANALMECDATKDVFQHCSKAVLVADIFGARCKCEVDLWNPATEHMLDLKSARDVAPKAFAKDALKLGYNFQWTFYLAMAKALGVDKHVFDFVCVRNDEPWTVAVHSILPRDNDQHRNLTNRSTWALEEAVAELVDRLNHNTWSGYDHYSALTFPDWAARS
jgi:exodeoxyribonuclease VIII